MSYSKGENQTFLILNFLDVLVLLIAMVRISDNLGKFDTHSDEAIFLSYALNSKAYRVYNLCNKVVEQSIHAIFYEKDNGILNEGFADLNYVMMMMMMKK